MVEKQETAGSNLLTVKQAAEAAAVSKQHVYRLVERGLCPALRVGDGSGPIRIPRDEFESWLWGNDGLAS